jgi:putative ABC transport system ATP-binding protein
MARMVTVPGVVVLPGALAVRGRVPVAVPMPGMAGFCLSSQLSDPFSRFITRIRQLRRDLSRILPTSSAATMRVAVQHARPRRGDHAMVEDAIVLEDVRKTYGSGETIVNAVDGVTCSVTAGEFVVILGASGSGKTTLLNMVGAIEEPSAGSLVVDGRDLAELDDAQRTDFRRHSVGFVFQLYNLVPTLTALENVQLIAELSLDDAESKARASLQRVGIADRADHFPGQLSGGQQQRVAIARALVKEPSVLLCDEPTGALDLESSRSVLGMLSEVVAAGTTMLMVTHNETIAHLATRVIRLSDGAIVSDERQDPVKAQDLAW